MDPDIFDAEEIEDVNAHTDKSRPHNYEPDGHWKDHEMARFQ